MEIFLIYGVTKASGRWLEYVCNSNIEAIQKIKILQNLKLFIPEIEDQYWDNLGLTFSQREQLIGVMQSYENELKIEQPSYYIEVDRLEDETTEPSEFIVLDVSAINSAGEYVHIIQAADGLGFDMGEIYKVSLSKRLDIKFISTINLDEMIVKERPAGFSYSTKKSSKIILKFEKWLFIKRESE